MNGIVKKIRRSIAVQAASRSMEKVKSLSSKAETGKKPVQRQEITVRTSW